VAPWRRRSPAASRVAQSSSGRRRRRKRSLAATTGYYVTGGSSWTWPIDRCSDLRASGLYNEVEGRRGLAPAVSGFGSDTFRRSDLGSPAASDFLSDPVASLCRRNPFRPQDLPGRAHRRRRSEEGRAGALSASGRVGTSRV
jgi:hypothetical protein